MSSINIQQLRNQLIAGVENVAANTSLTDVLGLVKGTELAGITTRRFFVNTVTDLPNLNVGAAANGSLFYVRSLGVTLMARGTQWVGLDGRVLRTGITVPFGWGRNTYNVLGYPTQNVSSSVSPVALSDAFSSLTWTQVAVGGASSTPFVVARHSNGRLYSWGSNINGVLGANTPDASRNFPTLVDGDISNWTQVSCGDRHAGAVTATGLLYTWGNSNYGRLGDNATVARSSPVTVAGGITNWSQVSCGWAHTAAVTTSGLLYTWGNNTYWQLGDGGATSTSRSSPATVLGGITNWSFVATHRVMTIAGRTDGILMSWGRNAYGQLGNNTTSSTNSPVTVVGGITSWSQVDVAGYVGRPTPHAITNGILYGWGSNNGGVIGDGTTANRSSPVTVVGGITNWNRISSMGSTVNSGVVAATTSTGVLYTWGDGGTFGTLGAGPTISSRSSPGTVAVPGFPTAQWTSLAAHSYNGVGTIFGLVANVQ